MDTTKKEDHIVSDIKGGARVEDQMRLRELELVTQYELKYLSDSFTDLKRFVKDRLDTENNRFSDLKRQVTWLTWLMLAQLAGINSELLIHLAAKLSGMQ